MSRKKEKGNQPEVKRESWSLLVTYFTCSSVYMGFPGGSVVKNLPAKARDTGSIPDPGRSPGEGTGNPL